MMLNPEQACHDAAELIAEADGLVITAGAGMGVDSGLPDFRGAAGFWRAYPALQVRQMRFDDIASPQAFAAAPRLAWGFYGHRLNLYRATIPHQGFAALRNMAARIPCGARVFTSNVDGQFQKAGFAPDHVTECHGSVHHMQCFDRCGQAIWTAADFHPLVDEAACMLQSAMPRCPRCGGPARPNILMFGDRDWDETRTRQQVSRLEGISRIADALLSA